MARRLGIGIVGGGRKARFYIESWPLARHTDIVGVWDPGGGAAELVTMARRRDVGAAKPYRSITAMIADSAIDALWIASDGDARVEHMEEVADAILRAAGKLIGIACEQPLGRTVADAQRITTLAAHAGLKHCCLESLVFAPEITRARDTLARSAHVRLKTQSGNVELMSALCRGTLVVRYLLSPAGTTIAAARPQEVTARIGSHEGQITVTFEAPDGRRMVGDVTADVRSGVTGTVELVGEGVAASWRDVSDLSTSGYEAQHEHVERVLLGREQPLLTFEDGLDAVRLVTTAYQSAAARRSIPYPPPNLETLVPDDSSRAAGQ